MGLVLGIGPCPMARKVNGQRQGFIRLRSIGRLPTSTVLAKQIDLSP